MHAQQLLVTEHTAHYSPIELVVRWGREKTVGKGGIRELALAAAMSRKLQVFPLSQNVNGNIYFFKWMPWFVSNFFCFWLLDEAMMYFFPQAITIYTHSCHKNQFRMAQILQNVFQTSHKTCICFCFCICRNKTQPEDALTLLAVNKGTYHGTTPI